GHDPWKADEPYTFGVVYHMLRSGDWIVPTVGGQPFVEKPPLYYWVSWATAAAASPWLALHDAARLASAVFVVIGIVATAWAARATRRSSSTPRRSRCRRFSSGRWRCGCAPRRFSWSGSGTTISAASRATPSDVSARPTSPAPGARRCRGFSFPSGSMGSARWR